MTNNVFLENPDTAIFTTRYVLNNGSPIVYIYHYEEDGAWEFLGVEKNNEEDYRVISLEEILEIDSSVLKVASMLEGYYATRKSKDSEWIINRIV